MPNDLTIQNMDNIFFNSSLFEDADMNKQHQFCSSKPSLPHVDVVMDLMDGSSQLLLTVPDSVAKVSVAIPCLAICLSLIIKLSF